MKFQFETKFSRWKQLHTMKITLEAENPYFINAVLSAAQKAMVNQEKENNEQTKAMGFNKEEE